MKYKIGFDFTYIIDNQATGVRKHGEEILEGLAKLNNDYEIVLFVNKMLTDVFQKKFPQYRIVPVKYWFKDIKYVRRINRIGITQIVTMQKEKCDLILHPYTSSFTPIIKNKKKIITIHDVIPLDEIKNKNSWKYKRVKKQNINMMNKSKYIITISEYSKKRLMDINPEYHGEIIVIPNSVSRLKETDKDVSEIIKDNVPYIFCINSFFKHKNQITLVKAFNRIKDKIPHKLVLVRKT